MRAAFLLAAAAAALFLLDTAFSAPPSAKQLYLPAAQNDTLFAVAGLPDTPAEKPALELAPVPQEQGSIVSRPAQDSYPVGTEHVTLLVENHATSDLPYSNWFDYRKIEGDVILPLTPRPGTMENAATADPAMVLKAGETMSLTIPIHIFDTALTPGVYRVSQLACFSDTGGSAFACTEIVADFTIQ